MTLTRLSAENRTAFTATLLLFFLFSASAFPTSQDPEDADTTPAETRSAFAALSDVRLVASGLLQLGKNLRDFVQNTKGQVSDILKKLNVFDTSFDRLSALTSEIKEEEEELKKTAVVLQASNEEIKSLSLEINSKVEGIMRERIQLWNQVGGLEEKLSGLLQGFLTEDQLEQISALKEVILTQEKSISDLLQAVKEQSEHLDAQKNKIKGLEKQLNSASLKETLYELSGDQGVFSVSGFLSRIPGDGSFSSTEDPSGFPSDCGEVFGSGQRLSGVYPVKPNRSEPFAVYCEFTDDGAYTVIQRRRDGSVEFNQPWGMYEDGFGDFTSEFWLGLRKIFSITQPGGSLLHIQIENWRQEKHVMEFRYTLDGPDSNYTIHLSAGDPSSDTDVPTALRFSTEDLRDGNRAEAPHCAADYTGGWWFSACGDINLNGNAIRSQSGRRAHGKRNKVGQTLLKSTQISVRHR